MSRKHRRPKATRWLVSAFGKRAKYTAKYAAGAVSQFRKQYGRWMQRRGFAIVTDHDTGGWKHVSVSTTQEK